MDQFWTKVMPASVASYDWGRSFAGKKSAKEWEKGISAKIQKMSQDEFDLFLASVVMTAAKEQLMGTELTSKIEYFRSLRK